VQGIRARTGSSAVALGTTTPGTSALPTATRTTLTTATTTWGSAWPERRGELDGPPLIRPHTCPSGEGLAAKSKGAPACS